MPEFQIVADSHAAPGFLALTGKSALSLRFAVNAQEALRAYFDEEDIRVPGVIRMTDDGKTAYVASPLVVYTASPL